MDRGRKRRDERRGDLREGREEGTVEAWRRRLTAGAEWSGELL
jgi:hypothetical protein